MAERLRSKDGSRETEKFVDDVDTPSQQGRSDGTLERKVGTRAEVERVLHGDGKTRVTKADEKGQGDLGGHHGTGEGSDS